MAVIILKNCLYRIWKVSEIIRDMSKLWGILNELWGIIIAYLGWNGHKDVRHRNMKMGCVALFKSMHGSYLTYLISLVHKLYGSVKKQSYNDEANANYFIHL